MATAEVEASLLNMARHSTAGQLARLARAYKSCLDRAELELSNERHRLRSLNYHFDDDGFLQLHGRLSPEAGAVLVSALDAAEESIRAEVTNDPRDPVTVEQMRADCLAEVARAAVAAPEGFVAARSTVVVHVDVLSLLDGSGGRCELVDGPSIASETARRLSCDCTLETLYEGDGELRDVGRTKRVVSARMRKALEARDKCCVFPGCDRRKFTEAHHIVHWVFKGETKLINLALLCFHHHRLMHEGGYTMRVEEDMTFTFFRPDGKMVARRPDLGGGDPARLIERNRQQQIAIDEATCTTLWDGRSVDLGACVHALLTEGGMLAIPRRGPPGA